MKTFAIVPVKELGNAKSRLQGCLAPSMRGQLILAMLKDVLHALKGISVIVISPEDIEELLPSDVIFHIQTSGKGLNNAVEEANEVAMSLGAEATLFVPADMPLITSADVEEVLEQGMSHPVVITHAMDGGTGILYRSPPNVMRSRFTKNSFYDHLEEAHLQGLDILVHSSSHLSFDIDTQEDLEILLKEGKATHSHRFLCENDLRL